jgi:hypothetical protein
LISSRIIEASYPVSSTKIYSISTFIKENVSIFFELKRVGHRLRICIGGGEPTAESKFRTVAAGRRAISLSERLFKAKCGRSIENTIFAYSCPSGKSLHAPQFEQLEKNRQNQNKLDNPSNRFTSALTQHLTDSRTAKHRYFTVQQKFISASI